MSLQLSNNLEEKGEELDPDKLIKCGIDTIFQSFNTNMGNYIEQIKKLKKIINDLSKKLELMKEEMEMIQREKNYYKSQNKKLKNEIDNLNKVVNNIKGKLTTKFDFTINNRKIVDDMEKNNTYSNQFLFNNKRHKNYFKNNISSTVDENHKNNSKFNNNIEYSGKPNTLKYDLKQFQLDDINENDINNFGMDQELNTNYFNEILNLDNDSKRKRENSFKAINQSNNKKTSPNSIYNNYKEKKINKMELNDNIDSHSYNNTINIKLTNNNHHNKYFNKGDSKKKKYTNNSLDTSSALKNKINFNNNGNEIYLKKLNEKNKVRSNSSNLMVQKEIAKNGRKYLTNRNNGKENTYPLINECLEGKDSGKPDYKEQMCQTAQNQQNDQNNDKNEKDDLKDIKIKEMTLFLKKCKIYLEQLTFEKIVKIFQDYKHGIINDEIIVQKVNHYLKNNNELLNLFKNIIS